MNTTYPNDILPFGVDASEARGDLLTLEEYLNDRQRLIGHQPGIGRRELANRQARQASHMAAGLAQFIANRFAGGVRDDGDLAAVETGLAEAVQESVLWEELPITWKPTANYRIPKIVLGSDGKLYLWKKASGPAVAGVGAKDPTVPANALYWLDYAASITPPPAEKYDIAQYTWFEDDMPRAGFFSCLGGVVPNFAAKYPKAAAYFNTTYGKKRLVTQAQYDALHVAIWHTNADGTKIGWNGIGGVNKFVWDKAKDTLRLPDLAGMTPEQVGYVDSLGVGGVRGDVQRLLVGRYGRLIVTGMNLPPDGPFNGAIANAVQLGSGGANLYAGEFDSSRVVPTGPRNHGPRYISDARVYLGNPLSL